jgi:threonyl-tRNA synthetase
MFLLDVEGQKFALKPMNCPSHCLMYNRDVKSYKDLPIRIADFCSLHRNEFSGTLSGLTRVRKFSQDDAHIFCRMDQIEDEVLGVLEFIQYVWSQVFNFKLTYYLSTRPENRLGSDELWDNAETLLSNALKKAGIEYKIKAGDGAFYGPKIDIDLEDALGRKWQCPTCQLDFNLPSRFNTTYIDADGSKKQAVMVHRAVLGSLERFFGLMTEHFAGKFPLWLSPVQVIVLPIADRHLEYSKTLKAEMERHGLRVEVDERTESTPKKVRDAQLQNIPIMITIGDKEMENHSLAVRTLDGAVKFGVVKDQLIQKLVDLIKNKSLKLEI